MNLIEQSNYLKWFQDKLVLRADKKADNNYIIRSWMSLSNVLNQLKEYSFLNEQIEEIFRVDDNINIRIDEWVTKPETFAKLSEKINTLYLTIDSCIKLIDEYTQENLVLSENEGLINIRMPDKIDMSKMSNICNDLDKVFNQCPLIKEEVKFTGVEKGSVYFVFAAGLLSINILGKILTVAMDVQKKYYQNEMVKNKLETMQSLSEHTKLIIEQLDDEIKEYSECKAMEIEESQDLNPEEIKRLALSIKTLSKLIGHGVQMQCVLCGEEKDVKIDFPKAEEFQSLMDSIKLLN